MFVFEFRLFIGIFPDELLMPDVFEFIIGLFIGIGVDADIGAGDEFEVV